MQQPDAASSESDSEILYAEEDLIFKRERGEGDSFQKIPPFSLFAYGRRTDQKDTEEYVSEVKNRFKKMTAKAKNAVHLVEIEKDFNEALSFINNGTFLSANEEQLMEAIPDAARQNSYIDILQRKSPLSGEDKVIHKYYLKQYACQYARRARNFFDNQIRENRRSSSNFYAALPYNSKKTGEYPVKDADGKMMRIVSIANKSHESESGYIYSSEQVKKFISSKLTEEQRSALYDGLSCVKFEKKDKSHDGESTLVGQNEVILARDFDEECAGIYGGNRISPGITIGSDDPLHAQLRKKFPAKYDETKALELQMSKKKEQGTPVAFIRQAGGPYLANIWPDAQESDSMLETVVQRLNAGAPKNHASLLQVMNPDTGTHDADVQGDNILAIVNSKFKCDKFGVPYEQEDPGSQATIHSKDSDMAPIFEALRSQGCNAASCKVRRADLEMTIPSRDDFTEGEAQDFPNAKTLQIQRVRGTKDKALLTQILPDGKKIAEDVDISTEEREKSSKADQIAQRLRGYVLRPISAFETSSITIKKQFTWKPSEEEADKKADRKLNEQLRPNYNVDPVAFRVEFENSTRPSTLHAFFVTGKKNDKARWNYSWSPSIIANVFRHGKMYVPEVDGKLRRSGIAIPTGQVSSPKKFNLPAGIAIRKQPASVTLERPETSGPSTQVTAMSHAEAPALGTPVIDGTPKAEDSSRPSSSQPSNPQGRPAVSHRPPVER